MEEDGRKDCFQQQNESCEREREVATRRRSSRLPEEQESSERASKATKMSAKWRQQKPPNNQNKKEGKKKEGVGGGVAKRSTKSKRANKVGWLISSILLGDITPQKGPHFGGSLDFI